MRERRKGRRLSLKKFVITIAREYGSGGKSIGKLLAKELGVSFYSREILRLASEKSGINESLFANADEKLKSSLLFRTARGAYKGELIPPDSDDYVSNINLFNFQAKVIRELAETESCVIVGRCADYILKDVDNVLRIYVHAPFDYCVARAQEVHPALSEDEVKKLIRKTDKRRADYYQYFTGRNWKDADNYDLCINSSQFGWNSNSGWEKCVALVKAYLEIMLG
jgi:cytidylate kinase